MTPCLLVKKKLNAYKANLLTTARCFQLSSFGSDFSKVTQAISQNRENELFFHVLMFLKPVTTLRENYNTIKKLSLNSHLATSML